MKNKLFILSYDFIPEMNSCSEMMEILAKSLSKKDFNVTVLTNKNHSIDLTDDYSVVQRGLLRKPKNNYLRAISEISWAVGSSFFIARNATKTTSILIYSPSIMLGLCGKLLKFFKCKIFIIQRDIFPKWALDAKILSNNLIYKFLEYIYTCQLQMASMVFFQNEADKANEIQRHPKYRNKFSVIQNWLEPSNPDKNVIKVYDLIYFGALGVAQVKPSDYSDLKKYMSEIANTSIIFSAGKIARKLSEDISGLSVHDPIDVEKLDCIIKSCKFSLILLNPNIGSENVPGKLIKSLSLGVPVLFVGRTDNFIFQEIKTYKIGYAFQSFHELSNFSFQETKADEYKMLVDNCNIYFEKNFDVERVSNKLKQQILSLK